MAEPRKLRLRILFGPEVAIGPGKVALLRAIREAGSISAGARAMNMSYRRAWLLVDTMNRCFREPVVAAAPGGKGGGGATVTPFGEDVLERYARMQRTAEDSVRADIAEFTKLLATEPPDGGA
jgi:molybdate transport system regulatory protein